MNRLSYALTVCAVVSFANMVFGVGESKIAEPLRVTLELTDGSRVIGEPVTSSIALQTAYATLDIPLKQIAQVKIEKDHKSATLDLANGEKLKGALNLKLLTIKLYLEESRRESRLSTA